MTQAESDIAITAMVKDLVATVADLEPPVDVEVAMLLDLRRRELSAIGWAAVWAASEMAKLTSHTVGQSARLLDGIRALPTRPLGSAVVKRVEDGAVGALKEVNAQACAQLTQRTQQVGNIDLAGCKADLRMLRTAAADTMIYIVNVVLNTLQSLSQIPATPTADRHQGTLTDIVNTSLQAMEEVVNLAIARFTSLAIKPPKRSIFTRILVRTWDMPEHAGARAEHGAKAA